MVMGLSVASVKTNTVLIQSTQDIMLLMENLLRISILDLTDDELMGIRSKVEREVTAARLPPISLDQLREAMRIQIHTDPNVTYQVDLPLVRREDYHHLLTYAVPDEEFTHRPKMTPHSFIMSEDGRRYALMTEVESRLRVNDTVVIIDKAIFSTTKNHNTPCDVKTLMTKEPSCQMEPLQGEIDEWYQTVAHNTFGFISNVRKTEICADVKTQDRREKYGLITLKRNCRLETPLHTIYSSLDLEQHRAHLIHISQYQDVEEEKVQLRVKAARVEEVEEVNIWK
jgi:hypothetical protein